MEVKELMRGSATNGDTNGSLPSSSPDISNNSPAQVPKYNSASPLPSSPLPQQASHTQYKFICHSFVHASSEKSEAMGMGNYKH